MLALPPPPSGITVVENGPTLVVKVRWLGLSEVANFVVSILLLGITAPIASQAPQLAMLLTLPFVPLAYWGLAGIVNSTTIRAGDAIEVSSGPLPWAGTGPIPIDRITSFDLRGMRMRRRRSLWEAVAVLVHGEQRLTGGYRDPARVKFLVDALNAHLASRRGREARPVTP